MAGLAAGVALLVALPAGAAAPVPLPQPQLPAPVAPPPPPSVPELPVAPPQVALPAPVEAPASQSAPALAPAPLQAVTGAPIPATGSATASGEVRDVVGDPRSDGEATEARRKRRERRGVAGTGYRRAGGLVRALRGCLDELPPAGSRLLVLRYGVGALEPMPAARVARRLRLSSRRYAVVRRRALVRLVRAARTTRCAATGLSTPTLTLVALEQARSAAAAAAAVGPDPAATPEPPAEDEGETRVLGAFAEDDDPLPEREPPRALGLPLADEASGDPYLLWLLAPPLALAALLLVRRRLGGFRARSSA